MAVWPQLAFIILILNSTGLTISAEDFRWCWYRFYSHPRTWHEARDICRQNNQTMELAHINDQSQHDYLASLIRSSLPAIHFNPPGPTMWIGLHKMSSEQPFWQDDCAGLSSGYNPVPTYKSAEACYVLHDQEPTYVEEDCNIPKPFICQAETLEYQSCYTEVRTVYDAIINNQYRVEDVASNCRFWCSFSNCVGYRFYDNEQGSCRFFTLSYGYTYKKGYLKFTKDLLRTDIITLTHTASLTQNPCPPQDLPTIETTLPPDSVHQTLLSSPTSTPSRSVAQRYAHAQSSASVMMTSTVVAMDHSDVLPSLSLLMPSTPVLLSSKSVIESTAVKTFTVLETALETLSNRIDQTDSPNQTQLEVYSEELYQHIADNSDVMCSYLREIENIEDQITQKMDALSSDELNTNSTTDWYLRIMNLVYGFEANNSGCHNSQLTLELLKLQDAFIKHAKLYMKTENILKTFEHSGTSVIIAVGDLDVLQGEYVTSYGRVVVQPRYFSRRMMSSSKRILMGIFYKENPFDQTQSSDDVSVPVITTFAFDEDGNEIPDINFLMGFPLPTTTSYTNNTINMLPNGTQYMAAIPGGFFNNSPAIVYVNISMMGSCRTYGKYGTTSPTDTYYDFYLHTNKMLSVTQYRPYSLMFSFIGGVIQLPIHQTPVVITVQCQDNTSPQHRDAPKIRINRASPQVIDRTSQEWRTTNGVQLTGGRPSEITLTSYFFGTFTASVKMIPPDMIDFQSVFFNFSEKLSDTPYVLGTVIAVLVLFVIITPVLYRRDNIDNTLWSYQHLSGNKATSTFRYYICISTGLRSKRQMGSTVYINITGTRGETGPRMLTGSNRKNFSNGTSSYFYLTTDVCIGNIKTVQIWFGCGAELSSWYLTRVVIIDGISKQATRLKCNRWLSMEKGTGQTWCTLKVGQNSDKTGDISEVSARNMLDDNLWFSLLFRPQYNRFTRVQRLWCVGSLLFLSMVASAMFYDTPDDTTPFVKTAYFEIGYKELYTGFISSAVTVVPSLIMTYIFSKRKLRGEKIQQIMYDSDAVRPFGRLPWWSIFLAYTVCLVCIASGSFFTFLYSVEWGPSLTIQWMSAFFIGTSESVILIEPLKALVLAVLIVCLCSEKTGEYDFHFPPISVYPKIKDIYNQGKRKDAVSPCDKPESTDQLRRRYTIRMDRKLNTLLRNFAMGLAYICVLLVIGSQQKVSEVSRQNLQIKNTLTATGEIKSIEDVWMYIGTVVLHRLYPSEFYNGERKSFDDLRFVEDNLKMGPLRIRQIRVSDTCAAPTLLRTYDIHCIPDYEADTEDKGVYMEGWIPWNASDLWDGVDTPYRYHYTSPEETPTYWGLFGTYGASGYLVDLDILPDEANNLANDLKNNGWLDQKTRAIFIEICLMNRNNRLFTQVQIVFELPSTGGVFMNTQVVSANLYPYTNTFDFIVLALQLIFVVTIFIRLVQLIVKVIKTRGHSLTTTSQVFDILHLGVSIATVVYFVMRFTDTISVLNTLRQDTGFYTSFGWVFLWDGYYAITLGATTFIAILDLLKHLSFNYHLFLMYKTILSFRSEVFHFLITLSILIVGFASLIHLIYGHSESGFSSMATSILTLFRMTIGIIKFRHDIQVVVVGIFMIIGLYASLATILFVNLFVSSLDHRISYIKECIRKGLTSFDSYLSSHFWNRLAKVITLCGSTRREQEYKCDTSLPKGKGEITCGRFLSKILKRFEEDSILERSALELVLLHLKRRCRRRATLNGFQYRYSIDWSKEDNTLIMEFFGGTVYCNITVDTYTIPEACRRGLVPYGGSTQPTSMVFKIRQLKRGPRNVSGQNAVTMDTKPVLCHVMIKVPSDILSSRPTFLLIRSSNQSDWHQLPATRNPAKEGEVFLSTSTSRFPHYVLAVTSDLWPGIPPTVQQNSVIEYTLTKSGDIFYLPGMCKKIAVMFPEACVSRDTEITILLERGDNFPILHFLARGDISGLIAVQFRRKRNIPTSGDDSEFKLMAKEGDLEWKEGTPGARTFQTDLSVQIDSLKESVKTSITVCKSDYVSLLHKKPYLDNQKGILLCIYNKTIPTPHWRKIGRNLGFSQKWLTDLEVRKPRTLEEKACVVLQQWLRENKGRNLFDVRDLWM